MKKSKLILFVLPFLLVSCDKLPNDDDGIIIESTMFWYHSAELEYICGCPMTEEKQPYTYACDEFSGYKIKHENDKYYLISEENEVLDMGYYLYAADVDSQSWFEACYCYVEEDSVTGVLNYCVGIYDFSQKKEIISFKGDAEYNYCIETGADISPLLIIKYKKNETPKSENREVGRFLVDFEHQGEVPEMVWKTQAEYLAEQKDY